MVAPTELESNAVQSVLAAQVLSEAILLSLLGGAAGVTTGALATALYAHSKHWTLVIPSRRLGRRARRRPPDRRARRPPPRAPRRPHGPNRSTPNRMTHRPEKGDDQQ
jgi:hypothetical protein